MDRQGAMRNAQCDGRAGHRMSRSSTRMSSEMLPPCGGADDRTGVGGGSRRRPVRLARFALVAALALVIAACGDDAPADSTVTPADPSAFPVTVRGTEIPGLPERIVSLSATHTEVLFEIGAGDRIIATDVFSDHPAAALETEKVDAFNLSVEAVAALDPDLVILSYDPGDAMSGFAALGIPAVLFSPPGPTDLDGVYAEWLDLGIATGHSELAEALVAQVSRDVDSILAELPQTLRSFTYFIELDSTLFTVAPGSLLDTVFGMLGMTNVVGPDAGPFPQVSTEFLLDEDPDFIFLADTVCCGETAETVRSRPGWNELSAVQIGNVVELDDSIASRWSHRILDLFWIVAREVYGI
jgi:iron complex transport system substrate-binding protein